MATLARTSAGICIEIPPEASSNYVSHLVTAPTMGSGNPNVLVELGKRLLDSAKEGDVELVQELLSRGAPMTADWLGTSPLHVASYFGHYQTAKMLLNAGCSRDARTKVEKTALHLAASAGRANIVDMLLNANAEVNCKDMLRMTPLHWAVESGDPQCVELLLRQGADVNVENKFDKSPLEIASDKGNTDIYEMLLNAESYRTAPRHEAEMATRTITNELNANQQYELTETITVPPGAAEMIPASISVDESSVKLLSNLLPDDEDEDSSSMIRGKTLSLTEVGKQMLSDTSPMKKFVPTHKIQTVQIKQEGSATPKIIRINGSASSLASMKAEPMSSAPGQPRVIRLSSSQLNSLKLATGFKGQKVVIVSSGANKVTSTPPASQTIRIVQVGNQPSVAQPKKTIAIMPAAASPFGNSTTTTTSSRTKMSTTAAEDSDESPSALKRRLDDAEEAMKAIREEFEQRLAEKMAEIKRLRLKLDQDSS